MKIEVTVNGKSYPCRLTMGAMLRYKQETGKEVTDLTDGDITGLCTYLWCCVASACSADKVDFDLSLMEFADSLTPDVMADWTKQVSQSRAAIEDAGDVQKKS